LWIVRPEESLERLRRARGILKFHLECIQLLAALSLVNVCDLKSAFCSIWRSYADYVRRWTLSLENPLCVSSNQYSALKSPRNPMKER
jgi:hypothetical protein